MSPHKNFVRARPHTTRAASIELLWSDEEMARKRGRLYVERRIVCRTWVSIQWF